MIPLPLRLTIVFLVGACLGSFANWAIYALAWSPRPFSPWSRLSPGASPRARMDRVPILGWFSLRRYVELHGRGYWVRPLLLEIGLGIALAALYWWEVEKLGLIAPQTDALIAVPLWVVHLQFISHTVLLCWMLAASFIDIDEKVVPDAITVSGTLLGLMLAALMPMSLLPNVAERSAATIVSKPLNAIGPFESPLWLEPVTAIAPRAWPDGVSLVTGLPGLFLGLVCYWLWCFALAPRIWRRSRGPIVALRMIFTRVGREFNQPPFRWLLGFGSSAIVIVWWFFERPWVGLLTALVGLVGSGGIVWAVRLIGTFSLRREAMGFGDVTLMMMVGTFLGWQACLITFFLSPFAALLVGAMQFVLRRDDEIPYVPYLCLAASAVVVKWAPIWNWASPMYSLPEFLLAVLIACLLLLGILLFIWRLIKTALFGDYEPVDE